MDLKDFFLAENLDQSSRFGRPQFVGIQIMYQHGSYCGRPCSKSQFVNMPV